MNITRENAVIYNTLYDDSQKPFIDYLIDQKNALTSESCFKWGMFLGMGFGKTKLLCSLAELHNADLVLVTSLKVKTTERISEGSSFAYELSTAGYECYYSDIVSASKKNMNEFLEAVNNGGKKIAYLFNYEQMLSKKGYAIINYLVGGYESLGLREKQQLFVEEYQKETNEEITFKEWFKTKGPNKGKGFSKVVWLMDEAHKLNKKSASVSKLVNAMLNNQTVPNISNVSRPNYFKEKIKGLYLGTGTPMTGGNFEDFFWLLKILDHEWGKTEFVNGIPCYEYVPEVVQDPIGGKIVKMVETFMGNMQPPKKGNANFYLKEKRTYISKTESDYEYFVKRYCVIDENTKNFNKNAKDIIGYKRTKELLAIVEEYAFFGDTSKHFKLPPIRQEIIWIPKGYGYNEMTLKKSPDYQVFDDQVCDTPALFYLRTRQLTSGFMGNETNYKYYNLVKQKALEERLTYERGNYLIFYQWQPELYAIISALEKSGYKYDIYNGKIKELETYYSYEKGSVGNVIIANIASGAIGLNRQKWNSVLFYTLPPTFYLFSQAISRVWRPGQESEFVYVGIMMVANSIDERVYEAIMLGKDYNDEAFEKDFLLNERE